MISKSVNAADRPPLEFSPELWAKLESEIEKAVRETPGRKVAAFDADGTLWDADAGETFFDWQIHRSGLKSLPSDPWAKYKELKKPDPRVGYVWLAQISKGHSLEQVRAWAAQCFKEKDPWPVFQSQKRLIELLKKHGVEVFIVTASVKWAVEPVAALVGVDFDHVLGIETEVKNGIVTDAPVHPITWREGKAEGLLTRTDGVPPLLASGNTYGDTHLLESATHIRLAVCTQDEPCGLYDEETKLYTLAKERGWTQHEFRERNRTKR